ncbi:MAG: type II toxin-antitoxin system RelE/ParE family toxin [Roseiarcus sp.]
MEIRTIRHKGLRRFVEDDDPRGLRADTVNRIRSILTALLAADSMDGVNGPPGWRIHRLMGDRAGAWSLSVTGNWRLTFEIEAGAIVDLDLEDYH